MPSLRHRARGQDAGEEDMIDLKYIPPLLDEATAMLKRDNDAAEWHDDKSDERADRHISTGPSDLGADGKPIIRRA